MTGCGFRMALVALLFAAAEAAAESGGGTVGDWQLVWRYSDAEGYQNRFREMAGNEADFPFRWRRFSDLHGDRLVFFDRDGAVEAEMSLEAGQHAIASEDGSAVLLWSDRPDRSEERTFRFQRRNVPDSAWEANAPGDPVLMAPDGSLFVIAAQEFKRDRFQRIVEDGSGRLQLVGAGGDVLGELPVYPAYSALGGGGEHVLFLHQGQVLALDRDGRLAWERPIPLDNLAQRGGVPQLATGPGVVVVCGTGRSGARSEGSMHTPRRGSLIALDEDGRVLWQRNESDDEELWFQMSAVVSPDGGTVVTCHAKANVLEIRAWDAAEGDLLWTQTAVRHSGFRCVSVAPGAALVVLAQCDNQTSVDAWDGEGTTVWSGNIPLASREAKIAADHWLTGEQWIVKLSSKGAEL